MSKTALWFKVQSSLTDSIRSGAFKPGEALPTEAELQARFGCSRHTIRTALQHLSDQGLIRRRPKIGSVVLSADPDTRHSIILSAPSDILPATPDQILRLSSSSLVTSDRSLASQIGLDSGTALFCFAFVGYSVRSSDVWPVTCRMRYYVPVNGPYESVNTALAQELRDFSEHAGQVLPEQILSRQLGIDIARTTVLIGAAPCNEYELKDSDPRHKTVLTVSRRFYDEAGNLLMASESRHYNCPVIQLEARRTR